MTDLLEAMARMEGWLVANSRCRRNHNPGNIEAGRFANAHGAVGEDDRFAVFPDAETGFEAMQALLQAPAYEGLTVAEALAKWAPSTENDTASYTELVCRWTGCLPSDALAPLVAGDVETQQV